MLSLEACHEEIEQLHEFFESWFQNGAGEAEFDRFTDALFPAFEMVTPEGSLVDREEIVTIVRRARGQYDSDPFEIEIRNVELIAEMDDRSLVRYEEWQKLDGEATGRQSTALLRQAPDAPTEIQWVYLHETWLEDNPRLEDDRSGQS